jgi:hypothetical protein
VWRLLCPGRLENRRRVDPRPRVQNGVSNIETITTQQPARTHCCLEVPLPNDWQGVLSHFSSLSIPLPPITHKIEYSTLIFLATEKKPPLKGTRYVISSLD